MNKDGSVLWCRQAIEEMEILQEDTTPESIAMSYAFALLEKEPQDEIVKLNKAIADKWGLPTLNRVKTLAWKRNSEREKKTSPRS